MQLLVAEDRADVAHDHGEERSVPFGIEDCRRLAKAIFGQGMLYLTRGCKALVIEGRGAHPCFRPVVFSRVVHVSDCTAKPSEAPGAFSLRVAAEGGTITDVDDTREHDRAEHGCAPRPSMTRALQPRVAYGPPGRRLLSPGGGDTSMPEGDAAPRRGHGQRALSSRRQELRYVQWSKNRLRKFVEREDGKIADQHADIGCDWQARRDFGGGTRALSDRGKACTTSGLANKIQAVARSQAPT